MPNWLSVLFIILTIYFVLSVTLYYLQDYFLFKPEKLPKDFQFLYKNQVVEEYNLETRDGAIINGLHFKVAKPKGVVLYLKGNSKSIKGWGKFAVDFTRSEYDVIMVYDKIKGKVDEKYIILYGRSLGSGFATKLASLNNPRMLILDAPYYSLTNVTGRYIPFMPLSLIIKYPMPTYKWLKYVDCPIRIIHGTQDKLIPFKSSVKLSQIKPKKTRLYPVIGGGHKNMNTFEEYHKILGEIIKSEEEEIDLSTTSIGVKHSYKR
jgi:pimeloyl-ACP methyl ester carboxylesterase